MASWKVQGEKREVVFRRSLHESTTATYRDRKLTGAPVAKISLQGSSKNSMKNNDHIIIDLSLLIEYFDRLREVIDRILPRVEDIPWQLNEDPEWGHTVVKCEMPMPFIDYDHPDWVKAYFPLNAIFYRSKAGKVRNSKNPKVADQNNNNVATCVMCQADNYGTITRKMAHRGFRNIVAALPVRDIDIDFAYSDLVIPKRFKNFSEMARCYDPENIYVRALGEVFDQHYPCNSTGQLRLL